MAIRDPQLESELPPGFPREFPFHGERAGSAFGSGLPASLTIAISREAGSRGNTIGTRAGRKLGWQIYNQELLEYIAQEGVFRKEIVDSLPADASAWAEARLQELIQSERISQHPSVVELARIVLSLGAQGDVVLIGRGAGTILPRETTLHVRTIAPLQDRVTYMSQWLRLTREEAEEQVRLRDERRAEFLNTHFQRRPNDFHQYDLVINSGFLGEDECAELIAHAARAKLDGIKSR